MYDQLHVVEPLYPSTLVYPSTLLYPDGIVTTVLNLPDAVSEIGNVVAETGVDHGVHAIRKDLPGNRSLALTFAVALLRRRHDRVLAPRPKVGPR